MRLLNIFAEVFFMQYILVEAKNAKYVERIEALNRKEAEMDRARSEVSKEMDKIDKETDQYLKQMSELEQRMIDLGIQEKEFDKYDIW